MSFFGRNIKKIRTAKKISQTGFADLFSLKRGSIGAYEEGRAEAKIDTVIQIAAFYKLTIDQLLCKELTINEIYHISEINRKFEKSFPKVDHEIEIPLLRENDRTKFIQNFNNLNFTQSLETIKLPYIKPASIAFEHNCFIKNSLTQLHPEIIISEPFILSNIEESSINQVFIIIENKNFHVGRIIEFGENIILKTNNLDKSNISINTAAIISIWKAYQYLSNQFPLFHDFDSRLQVIEKKIDSMLHSKGE